MILVLPPPVDGLKKAREQARMKAEAESAVIEMLCGTMLESNLPEARKIELRIMLETKKLTDKIKKAFLAFAEPVRDEEKTEALFPVRKEVYEYLQLVSAGVDTFLETHPAPVNEDD